MGWEAKIVVAVVLAAVLLASVSSFLLVNGAEEPKAVRFGCALSLSGELEKTGQLYKEGYALWIRPTFS